MSALNPVLLNAEFWLLWSVRQLLRGAAIVIGVTSGMVTLVLIASVGALGLALEAMQERSRAVCLSGKSRQLITSAHGRLNRTETDSAT